METIKKNSYLKVPLMITILMFLVFIYNEKFIPGYSAFIIFLLLMVFSFYFVPYRLLKGTDITISKGVDITTNILLALTCGYSSVLLFARNSNVIDLGGIIASVNTIFSFYVLYLNKENSKKVFLVFFIITFFLLGLVKFSELG